MFMVTLVGGMCMFMFAWMCVCFSLCCPSIADEMLEHISKMFAPPSFFVSWSYTQKTEM